MWYVLFALLAAGGLVFDQWLKAYMTANIPLGQTQPLIPGIIELRTVHNYGAAWSSFSGQRWLLVIVTCCIVAAVAWCLIRRIVRHPLGVAACFMVVPLHYPVLLYLQDWDNTEKRLRKSLPRYPATIPYSNLRTR